MYTTFFNAKLSKWSILISAPVTHIYTAKIGLKFFRPVNMNKLLYVLLFVIAGSLFLSAKILLTADRILTSFKF